MPLGEQVPAARSAGEPADGLGSVHRSAVAAGQSVQTGTLIDGRYVILQELGRGGMGRVFAARDGKLDRPVAIKFLAPGAHDDHDLRRFEQEARTAGSLNHPNIVAVYDIGTHEGEPYIVSELLEGATLRERLRAEPLPPKQAIHLAIQLAHGLSAAHDKGVVHRDLKPENLFITDDGRLKILDFGVAKLVASLAGRAARTDPASTSLTEPGAAVGTVGYMSPEQVRGQDADHRSDIFAFGAIFYEMLSGQRAFERASAVETGFAILKNEPPEMPALAVPDSDRIVRRCLAKDPAERFQSARDLAFDLEGLLAPGAAHSARTKEAGIPRRGAVVGLAVLVLGGAGAVLWGKLSRPEMPLSRNVVAVLPFAVRGSDQFAYLGEGMVDLLSTNLGGGDLRAVDPHALVRFASRDASPLDPGRSRSIARHFGAGRYVLGTVLEVEKRLRIHASLYDVEAGAAPIAEAMAEGGSGQLFHLIDELTAQLRARIAPRAGPQTGSDSRLTKSAQITTSSPEALKAYLEGEAELRRGSWRRARASLERAVGLDPEFSLANYRLAVAASMWEPGLASDALQRALAYSDRLSDQDRALMRAFVALRQGRMDDAHRQYRAILDVHPDDVEAWYELGELLFHFSPLHGRPASDAREPLEQALVLDPEHGGTLYHLVDIAQMQGQKKRVLALSERYLRVTQDEAGAVLLPREWTRAWAADDEEGKTRLREGLRRSGASKESLPFAVSCALWQRDDLGDAAGLAQMLAESETAGKQAEGLEQLAILDLAHGRFRAAQEKMARAAELAPNGPFRLDALWFATLEFLPLPPKDLRAVRTAASVLESSGDPLRTVQQVFVRGALAVRAGDLDGAEAAAKQLQRMPEVAESSIAGDLALAVRARVALSAARYDDALALLDRMRLQVPYGLSGAFVRLSEQHLRAQLLEARGRDEDALRLYGVFSFYGRFEPIYFAPSHLHRAAIHDRRGDREKAVAHYLRFVQLWSASDPELRSQVDAARRRLELLGWKPGSSVPVPAP